MASSHMLNRASRILYRWETFLVILFLVFNVYMAFSTRYYFDSRNLLNMTTLFMEKGIIALVMAMIIITGNIDISVGSTLALSSVVMGSLFQAGMNIWIAAIFALLTGAACGFLNGFVITRFGLPSVIVTLANFSFFRGLAYVILGDKAVGGYPESFQYIGNGTIGNTEIPIVFVLFVVLAVIAAVFLHRTKTGRVLFAMGWNSRTCRASGVPVKRITLLLFVASGLASALASIFLTSRIANTRPNIATGFELEIIATVILGGVAITGGIGKIWGVVVALFFLGTVSYGLGMNNVPSQYLPVITGSLLLISIVLNNWLTRKRELRIIEQERALRV